ncbi:MAG: sigma-70 region 4 domain-containing protein [Actinobacteria bacterium]|nr:sigma-70 region 4 domain-containing protein [Actinomycetota bacterium]
MDAASRGGKDGQVVALRYRDLLEPAEIAERMEVQPNAVYQAIHRALAKLGELDHA